MILDAAIMLEIIIAFCAYFRAKLEADHLEAEVIISAAKFGLLSGNAPTSLDLDALKLHNLLEHDASISCNDFGIGDNLHLNETVFTTLASANPDVNCYNVTSAGQVQYSRWANSLAINPKVTNTRKEFIFSTIESALYLSVMGDPLPGVAPKKYIFFREERLPIPEGWSRSMTMITTETMSPIQDLVIQAANGA
ncbi:hypothetical protein B0H17DRAFT_1193959 [Mycena rosella]|uniref:Heme haloperoxidase family profile domain-containing protein n=1 Tax=Mycena rosella TaxID=1033263 RepID=A0AAD7GS55_MYCRO|nr:hypothetical protein B0H17DRAFT_1193959 [Mycena rosella]